MASEKFKFSDTLFTEPFDPRESLHNRKYLSYIHRRLSIAQSNIFCTFVVFHQKFVSKPVPPVALGIEANYTINYHFLIRLFAIWGYKPKRSDLSISKRQR